MIDCTDSTGNRLSIVSKALCHDKQSWSLDGAFEHKSICITEEQVAPGAQRPWHTFTACRLAIAAVLIMDWFQDDFLLLSQCSMVCSQTLPYSDGGMVNLRMLNLMSHWMASSHQKLRVG